MLHYNIKYLLILLFIFGCATPNFKNQETKLKNKFENTGFSLIYDEQHYRNKKQTITIHYFLNFFNITRYI